MEVLYIRVFLVRRDELVAYSICGQGPKEQGARTAVLRRRSCRASAKASPLSTGWELILL